MSNQTSQATPAALARSFAPGMALAGATALLWARLDLPRMPADHLVYAFAWLCLLAGPSLARFLTGPWPKMSDHLTFSARAFEAGAYLAGLVFLAFLLAAPTLGNYKLWLGTVYLGGVIMRLAGLSQVVEARLRRGYPVGIRSALAGAAISAAAGIFLFPWLRPDLSPGSPWLSLGAFVANACLWGGAAGAFLFAANRLASGNQRGVWLSFLGVGLGPMPVLAVGLFPLAVNAGALAAALLAAFFLAGWRKRRQAGFGERALPLYWLVRALMLMWWGLGLALALALAWWQPDPGMLVRQGVWLRAILMGVFLVTCLGLLAEYSLPLFRRAESEPNLGPRKLMGVLISALALVTAVAPLLLMPPAEGFQEPKAIFQLAKFNMLGKPVTLSPGHERVQLGAPGWVSDVSRVYIISYMEDGARVPQGQPVLQITAVDQLEAPHFYALRAGVDTADWELAKRDVAVKARHKPARAAKMWTRYTAHGESFQARQYYTGIFLGQSVRQIKTITLRYIYEAPQGEPQPKVRILRVFVY